MITPYQLLKESGFAQYTAMIRVRYNRDNKSLGAEKIAEMIRAIPGATRVSTVSLDKDHGIGIFNAKIISQKPAKEAYQALKQNALERYAGLVTGLDIGVNTIEVKGDFILKENLRNLDKSNLGQYIGQLLEEGLLLEVSIDELRRQWVESGKMDEAVFNQIVQASNNQSNYATWLVKKVASNLIGTEDLSNWSEIFTFFDRYKQRFQKKDINQVKTAEDIQAFVADYTEVRNAVEAGISKSNKEKTDPCLLGRFKTSDGRGWTVYKVGEGQWEQERKIGSGTEWCTVASKHYFEQYQSPRFGNDKYYYIFIDNANPKDKYQIHYGSDQFMDAKDNPVDRSEDWAIEFFKYLKERDGRTTFPPLTQRGMQENLRISELARELETSNLDLSGLGHIEAKGGEAYYLHRVNSDHTKLIASLFLQTGTLEDAKHAVKAAEKIQSRWTKFALLKLTDGTKTIILPKYNTDASEAGSVTPSSLVESSRIPTPDSNLPQATSGNFELYKQVCVTRLGLSIDSDVYVRCSEELQGLDHFLVKTEGNTKVYKFDASEDNCTRMFLQVGVPQYARRNMPSSGLIYENPTTLAPIKDLLPDLYGGKFLILNSDGGTRKPHNSVAFVENMDSLRKVYEDLAKMGFDFISDPKEEVPIFIYACIKLGGNKSAIQKKIREDTKHLEGTSSDCRVGRSFDLKIFLHRLYSGLFEPGEILGELTYALSKDSKYIILIYKSKKYVVAINIDTLGNYPKYCRRKKDLEELGIPLEDLAKVYSYAGISVPSNLENALRTSRNGNTISRLLYKAKDLQNLNLPAYPDSQIRLVNGVYGTWDQVKDPIKISRKPLYDVVTKYLQEHPDTVCDCAIGNVAAFMRYRRRLVPPPTVVYVRCIQNDVVACVMYSRGNELNIKDIPEDHRVPAGTRPQSNVPSSAERTRQSRERQAADQSIQPTPEQLQQIQQYRIQVTGTQEAYRFDEQHVVQGLAALGFDSISRSLEGENGVQAVVYRADPHRGNTTYVALIVRTNNQTIVAGYPQNPTLATAAADSDHWRRLTRQLDNSVRTFQQCFNICRQLHITLPVGIQGWLVYRGQNTN